MFRLSRIVIMAVLLISFISVEVSADNTKNLLKGIGQKKKRVPSVNLLLRDDLKAMFQEVMEAYFAEDKEKYIAFFHDSFTMASRTLSRKSAKATKQDLDKRVTREFKRQDFTKLTFAEAFDPNAPTMMFVMSEEQMRSNIPVWGFAAEPEEITRYMKPGDFLVIANTLPEAAEKALLPTTIYTIVRKIDGKFKIVGID